MKRMALIAVALSTALIMTVVAGVVSAQQGANTHQAGKSSVYHFDVPATDTHGSGKLTIDLDQHTFVFNGKDFQPGKTLYLQYKLGTTPGINTFASATVGPSGNLHIAGTWIRDIATLPAAPTFSVGAISSVYAKLHWGWNPPSYTQAVFNAQGSAGPIVEYRLLLDVAGQYDNYQAYTGPNVGLNDHGAAWSDPVNINAAASYAFAELIVSDSNRNTAFDVHDLIHEPSG